MTPQPVVVAFDNSAGALDALALGSWLARTVDEPLLVVATYPKESVPVLPGIGDSYLEEMKQTARDALSSAEEILDGQPAHFRSIGATSTARGLDSVAGREDASMLVIGSGRHGPHRRVGNTRTANHLLHGAPAPIVLAPRGIREQVLPPASRIGCAFTPTNDGRAALRQAAGFARRAGASLEVFTVASPPGGSHTAGAWAERSYMRQFKERLSVELDKAIATLPSDVEAHGQVLSGDAVDALAALDDRDCQLLVCGSRGYGPVRRVLLGSVSEQLVRRAACPVMVVPRGGRP